jgi:Mlc titration factor MtfA (ptsG expression regulator)
MTIASIILIFVLYRAYLIYKKRTDWKTLKESQNIYLHTFFPKHFSYYNLLTSEEKEVFITRSIFIRKNLEFYSTTEDLMITENIKILMSAAFTQITFGFDPGYLEDFNKIFLHPSIFYSRWVQRDVKGLAFGNGVLHLSWEDFVKGYMFDDDKINLALHELAHALQIECFDNISVDTPEYDAWVPIAKTELEHMRANPESAYLRAYAATNLHEFFAVCVEYFFEDPKTFRQKLPPLYQATCKVLNQDMAARMDRKPLSAS